MTDRDDELAQYAADQELNLYKEYRDVIGLFRYIVETDRRFYLANSVEMVTHHETGDTYFELLLEDAWVWDVFRTSLYSTSSYPELPGYQYRRASQPGRSRHAR